MMKFLIFVGFGHITRDKGTLFAPYVFMATLTQQALLIFATIINVAPIDESDDDSDDEVDFKLEQATKKRKNVELLIEFDRMDAANRPGKGYITGGGQRSLNIIPPLNDAIYELCMRSPSKRYILDTSFLRSLAL